jgi:hypothetical protein
MSLPLVISTSRRMPRRAERSLVANSFFLNPDNAMSFFSNLKIGPRLGFAFATVIALATVVVVIGITRLSSLNESLITIGEDRLPKVVTLVEIGDDVNLVARELRNQLIWDDPAKQAGSREVIEKSRETITKAYEKITPTVRTEQGKKLLAATLEARAAFTPEGEADYAQAKLLMFVLLAGMAAAALTALKAMNESLVGIVVHGAQQQRQHRHRLGADRQRQRRPEPAHRRTGQRAAADRGVDGTAGQHRASRTPTTRARPTSWRRAPARVAQKGGEVMGQVVGTMQGINDQQQEASPTSSASSTASPSRPTSWR